jgi:hypothetical protein
MTMDGLKKLLASRKAWAMAISNFLATVLAMVHLYATFQGYSPDKLAAIDHVLYCLGGVAVASGMLIAFLIGGSEFARAYGVTDAPPEEQALRAQLLAEIAARVPPDVRAALIQAQQPAPQGSQGRPVS